MEWPCRAELWGDRLEAAREAYAEVATAIARFEPVTMIAKPKNFIDASLAVGKVKNVAMYSLPHDDSWMRDNGPTFVVDGNGQVAGVDWRWNAWGNKYPDHERDAAVAEEVLKHLAMRRYEAPFVLEGGAVHTDGEGTLLTTESVLLNPNRNPGIGRADMEELLAAYLGIRKVIWLGDGLKDDDTDGHIDNLACFVKPGVVLALSASDPADANHAPLKDGIARLRAATDAQARPLPAGRPPHRRLLHQLLHCQRRRDHAGIRGSAGCARLRDRRQGLPRSRGRAGAGRRYRLWRRRHPLHHPAGAGGHAGGAVRA